LEGELNLASETRLAQRLLDRGAPPNVLLDLHGKKGKRFRASDASHHKRDVGAAKCVVEIHVAVERHAGTCRDAHFPSVELISGAHLCYGLLCH
jgi:hypothetical protein